ncbi:PREDICTED: keratinocyte proline-rich protein-like [Acromyrmex echinatior]|uniref:keratinocyte proline-rich protein-like n=1 Tax=Acromyrmex echinatior TaxID=103372 RepID=UPI000580D0B3|nr:PREDICTED: keratinocyte proline-rich protein-like [Acromyrmex echinatior]
MSPLMCSLSQCSQNVSKNIQEISKKLPKLQRNKTYKTSSHRNLCYPIFLHRRGFHSSLFLAKSDSNKPSACKEMDELCKPIEIKEDCSKPCKEKSDVCYQEKVKCDKSQRNKKTKQKHETKIEKKIMESECKKTCLPIGKCELPRTLPPPKMEYAKVTCAPPKFAKLKSCPHLEHIQKDDEFDKKIKLTNPKKKKICAPLPLPKPPNAPIILCPCPPPPKLHPGSCPCYEIKALKERPPTQPCLLKKKYPCPTDVYYCPPQKKPCNQIKLESEKCEHRKKKNTSAS